MHAIDDDGLFCAAGASNLGKPLTHQRTLESHNERKSPSGQGRYFWPTRYCYAPFPDAAFFFSDLNAVKMGRLVVSRMALQASMH